MMQAASGYQDTTKKEPDADTTAVANLLFLQELSWDGASLASDLEVALPPELHTLDGSLGLASAGPAEGLASKAGVGAKVPAIWVVLHKFHFVRRPLRDEIQGVTFRKVSPASL